MSKDLLYLVDLSSVELSEGETKSSWIHALPLGDYQHPVFGKIQITADRIKRFADNVKNKVRGIDLSLNYNHNNENDASGWVKDAESRDTGLWLFVEWTKNAAEKIKNKEYRYFSAEYHDKWKDAKGTEHTDVLFGGALTNRPYMKNLLPINLSEASIDFAFGLTEAITNAKKEVDEDVDLKKYAKLLGLDENATQEDFEKKLAELSGGNTPPPVVDPPKGLPTVPEVKIADPLKKLAEENPMVKALIDTVDAQNKALSEHNVALREAEVSKKLSEFDSSKIILTPVAKDKIHDFLMEAPVSLHEDFWHILGLMKSSSGVLVELGERAGTTVKYGKSKDSVSLFMDLANQLSQTEKISLSEAMERVSSEQPDLYNQYRANSYAFQE